ncbi:MAG: cytochrome c [Bacteroidota bacterium]|nr:cytochrome c [Bacteroidota bacterium]
MPAFGPTHSDEKIWAITDFLLNKLSRMSPEEYQVWMKKYSE